MLEELVLLAARWGVEGGSIERICDMDIVTFSTMSALMHRIETRERYMDAWTNMVSSQGTHKGMKEWTKPWLRTINSQGAPQSSTVPEDDSAAFKKKFGRGL